MTAGNRRSLGASQDPRDIPPVVCLSPISTSLRSRIHASPDLYFRAPALGGKEIVSMEYSDFQARRLSRAQEVARILIDQLMSPRQQPLSQNERANLLFTLRDMLDELPRSPETDRAIVVAYEEARTGRPPLDPWPARCPWDLVTLIAAAHATALRLDPGLAIRTARAPLPAAIAAWREGGGATLKPEPLSSETTGG